MAVFRIERTKDYTVMSNHHLRNHELLSFYRKIKNNTNVPIKNYSVPALSQIRCNFYIFIWGYVVTNC